jgi:hypothetical protein
MKRNIFYRILPLIVGVMLVFGLMGCDNGTTGGNSGTGGNGGSSGSGEDTHSLQWTLPNVAVNHGKTQSECITYLSTPRTYGLFATWLGITFDELVDELIAAIANEEGLSVTSIKQLNGSEITEATTLSILTGVLIFW